MLATYTIFSALMRITLPKLHVKLQPHPLKIFWANVEKVQKTHKLCIIMLINPSYYIFLEKNIFDASLLTYCDKQQYAEKTTSLIKKGLY